MTKKSIAKVIYPTLLATVFTVPAAAPADTQARSLADARDVPALVAQAIKRETVQFFRMEDEPGKVQVNIAGQPGVNFRFYYSVDGSDGTYRRLKGAAGTIGENGIVSIVIDTGRIRGRSLHLKIFTADDAGFTGEVRTGASVFAFNRTKSDVRMRGLNSGSWNVACYVTAVAAVRGKLPEEVEPRRDDTGN